MSIVEQLKKLIASKGGNASGITTVSEGVKALTNLENAANPLSALTVDVTIADNYDLLGKYVGDLQDDVVVGTNKITGSLNYIDDYTGFSSDSDEQAGHYLVLHATVPEVDGVTINFKGSTKARTVDLESDGIVIYRVTDLSAILTFTASKSGEVSYSRSFTIAGMTLLPEEEEVEE